MECDYKEKTSKAEGYIGPDRSVCVRERGAGRREGERELGREASAEKH